MNGGVQDPSFALPVRLPRSGPELLRATSRLAREQRFRSWWHLWSTVAVLSSLLVLTILPLPWFSRILASGLLGLTLVRMFILYHDHQHGTILRRSRMATLMMSGFGIVTLNPPSYWKRSHDQHHKHNCKIPGGGVGTYPIMTIEGYSNAPRLVKLRYLLSRHPLTILFGYVTVFFYCMCLKPFLAKPVKHWDCGAALLVQTGLIVGLLVWAPDILLLTIVLPVGLAAALGSYLFYCQHNFPGVKHRARVEWEYVNAALHSSSYLAMGPILRWFTGNIGYHHVHHLNPHIPFYRLPEAMREIQELQGQTPIRLTAHDVWACLRLKLWDPDEDRMVPFRSHRASAGQHFAAQARKEK